MAAGRPVNTNVTAALRTDTELFRTPANLCSRPRTFSAPSALPGRSQGRKSPFVIVKARGRRHLKRTRRRGCSPCPGAGTPARPVTSSPGGGERNSLLVPGDYGVLVGLPSSRCSADGPTALSHGRFSGCLTRHFCGVFNQSHAKSVLSIRLLPEPVCSIRFCVITTRLKLGIHVKSAFSLTVGIFFSLC